MRNSVLTFALLISFGCTKASRLQTESQTSADSDRGTTLEIPLQGVYYVNHKEIDVDLTKLNAELKKKGLAGVPETIVIGKNPAAYYKVIEKRIEAANEALQRKMIFNLVHEGHIYELSICYRGQVEDVPALIQAMVGNFLNAEQGILAIAAGKKKLIEDESFKSRSGLKERFGDEYEGRLTTINQWLNYDSKSKTAIVMSDFGPQGDGTELKLSKIPPCK